MSKMFLFKSLVVALLLLTAKKFKIDTLIRFASTQDLSRRKTARKIKRATALI